MLILLECNIEIGDGSLLVHFLFCPFFARTKCLFYSPSHYLPCYPGAGLGIGKGMVVILEVITQGGSHGVELMVGQVAELVARGAQGVEEDVVRVVHLVGAKSGA